MPIKCTGIQNFAPELSVKLQERISINASIGARAKSINIGACGITGDIPWPKDQTGQGKRAPRHGELLHPRKGHGGEMVYEGTELEF